MRHVLLCILLVCGSDTPSCAQQLKEITNSIGMKFVLIHPGSFAMGSPSREIGRNDWESEHEETISEAYYLGAFEVTQSQFEKVMGNNPSHFKGSQLPVETVDWENVVTFCRRLSELPAEKAAGRKFRLPTEAEWEYACRATSVTSYSFGDSAEWLGEYAWFGENAEGMTHPVGEKKSNRWGLFDMHGNVWEWCSNRGGRGGAFGNDAATCRTAFRSMNAPTQRNRSLGLRIALSPPSKHPDAESSR